MEIFCGESPVGEAGCRIESGPFVESQERREQIDWRYGHCSLNADPSDFGPFEGLVSLWQSKRNGRLFPARADFGVAEFKPWLGRIAIVNLETDPFNVRFVLWGTQLAEWWGADYTNKSLGDLAAQPELFKEVEGQYFLEMKSGPFIGLIEGKLEQHYHRYRKLMGVDLPLGSDGTVEQVLLVHEEIAPDASLEELLPDSPAQYFY